MAHLLDIVEFFAISFGLHKSCLFFSGLNNDTEVLSGDPPECKKNCLDSVYSHDASQKKPRKHVARAGIINSFAGPLNLEDVASTSGKPTVSWDNEVGSEASSISGLSDVKNMRNMIAKKTSYVNSNNSVVNEDMDDIML
ncbi:hypothetical protein G9A89_013218 [Geosiphon pyriformis]|nr:hypothetical protein G9A89_013218 [Geosiphon pyriformis]